MLQIAYIVTKLSGKRHRSSYKVSGGWRKERILENRGILWGGLIVVLVVSAYLVPYTLLSGIDAPYGSFLFWTAFGAAAIAAIAAMTRSWRD